jgi:hypothetical protein
MRIVAWNCCRGPMAKKVAALETPQPDVAVLAEAAAPSAESDQLLWFPSNASRLGIQVRSFGASRIKSLRAADLPNCVVPVRVSGPVNFNLIAIWTWPAPSYTQALLNGLSAYDSLMRRGPWLPGTSTTAPPSTSRSNATSGGPTVSSGSITPAWSAPTMSLPE